MINRNNNQGQPAKTHSSRRTGLTLVELTVTIVTAALVVSALATSLHGARTHTRSEICLNNLRSLGLAIRTYAAEYNDVLPGPLHPVVTIDASKQAFMDLGFSAEYAELQSDRFLTTLLRRMLGEEQITTITTCPTMAEVVSDQNFAMFSETTGRTPLPAHYTLNNWQNSEYGIPSPRGTTPPNYFGLSPAPGIGYPTSPIPITSIPNASREWIVADAWYRPRANPGIPFLQQEGTFQTDWTGEALPNFAPHMRRAGRHYQFISSDNRSLMSSRIRTTKSDGITNTLFADGHIAPVPSREAIINTYSLFYGFPGTVNPDLTPQEQNYWDRIVWR